jgi:hypothetical protein
MHGRFVRRVPGRVFRLWAARAPASGQFNRPGDNPGDGSGEAGPQNHARPIPHLALRLLGQDKLKNPGSRDAIPDVARGDAPAAQAPVQDGGEGGRGGRGRQVQDLRAGNRVHRGGAIVAAGRQTSPPAPPRRSDWCSPAHWAGSPGARDQNRVGAEAAVGADADLEPVVCAGETVGAKVKAGLWAKACGYVLSARECGRGRRSVAFPATIQPRNPLPRAA